MYFLHSVKAPQTCLTKKVSLSPSQVVEGRADGSPHPSTTPVLFPKMAAYGRVCKCAAATLNQNEITGAVK